jgi:hypothetical protein
MSKKKRIKKNKKRKSDDIWTEEEYEKYVAGLYGLKYIAGFTDSGVSFGIPEEEIVSKEHICDYDDEIPF